MYSFEGIKIKIIYLVFVNLEKIGIFLNLLKMLLLYVY